MSVVTSELHPYLSSRGIEEQSHVAHHFNDVIFALIARLFVSFLKSKTIFNRLMCEMKSYEQKAMLSLLLPF